MSFSPLLDDGNINACLAGEGTLMGLITPVSVFNVEYAEACKYVRDFEDLEEFTNVKFMLACFTLLEAGRGDEF